MRRVKTGGRKLREAIFVFLIFGWAMCGPACSHHAPSSEHAAVRSLSACVQSCPGASAVQTAEVPERGQLCRCWAPNAFSYTFSYPDTEQDFDYVRQRWISGMKAANECRARGLGWEPDQTRDNIVCVKPTSAEPLPQIDPLRHAALHGRNKPAPRWLRLTPWDSWRPVTWKRSA